MNNSRMSFAISTMDRQSVPRKKRIMAADRERLLSMLGRLPIAQVADNTGLSIVGLAKLLEAQRRAA